MELTDKLEILADAAKYDACYGFVASELLPASGGNLALDIDPKSSEVLRRSLAEAPQQMNLWTELQAA